MELIENKENLQSEYDKLTLELTRLKRLYIEAKKKHSKMELKDLELYYELEDLSNELKAITKIDEENEKQYIENNCNKLALKLPFTCGVILSIFISILSLIKGSFITKTILTMGLIVGHLSSGIIIGIALYVLYKKKYQSILKERYKNSDIHKKSSNLHYDKMLTLMRKKEEHNKYHQEYLKVKEEYINLERNLFKKQEELKQFKEKVFDILFPREKEDLETSEEIPYKEDIPYCDKCYYKEPSSCKKILKK